MDSFDFSNAQQQLSRLADSQEEAQQNIADSIKNNFDDKVKKPLEGLGYPLIDEGGVGILRNVFTSSAKKLGMSEEMVKSIGDKLNALKPSEYIKDPKGTIKKLFGDASEKVQSEIESRVSNVTSKIDTIKADASKLPSKAKDFITKKGPRIDKPLQISGEKEDLLDSLKTEDLAKLGSNPSIDDLRNASIRRTFKDSINLKDDLTNAQTGGSKVDILTGRIQVKQPQRPPEPEPEPEPAPDPPPRVPASKQSTLEPIEEEASEGGKGVGKVEKVLKDVNKVDETEVETDAENPIGDLIAAGIGIITGITGLFIHHARPKFNQIRTIVPSIQTGA